jgi:hypothetical protein
MMDWLPGTGQPTPLRHLAVRALTANLLDAWQDKPSPSRLTTRAASLDEVRAELRRRERLGVGVRL